MTELEDRLRLGHPEERDYRPPPFAAVTARPARRSWRGLALPRLPRPIHFGALVTVVLAAVAVAAGPLAWAPAASPQVSSAGQAPAAAPSPKPVLGALPSQLRESLDIRCGGAAAGECDRIVDAVVADAATRVLAVTLDPWLPGCQRATPCPAASDGLDPYLAEVRGTTFSAAYFCDAASTEATCRRAAAVELEATARMSVVVDGATNGQLDLVDASGTAWSFRAAPRRDHALSAGRWTLVVTGVGEPCSAPIDLSAGERVSVTISLGPGQCRIEVR